MQGFGAAACPGHAPGNRPLPPLPGPRASAGSQGAAPFAPRGQARRGPPQTFGLLRPNARPGTWSGRPGPRRTRGCARGSRGGPAFRSSTRVRSPRRRAPGMGRGSLGGGSPALGVRRGVHTLSKPSPGLGFTQPCQQPPTTTLSRPFKKPSPAPDSATTPCPTPHKQNQACASCGPRAGCSRACGWWRRPSSPNTSPCPGWKVGGGGRPTGEKLPARAPGFLLGARDERVAAFSRAREWLCC